MDEPFTQEPARETERRPEQAFQRLLEWLDEGLNSDRVFAILFLLGGLSSSPVSAYLYFHEGMYELFDERGTP
ncbi:MAG TPA: hypothetical protein VLN44_04590 [Pyrinomonadaceae bacterium]|nr:hypothetical protein [Pyrinomonadaceae bacterium]